MILAKGRLISCCLVLCCHALVHSQVNVVDAAVHAYGHTYLFQGDRYYRFSEFQKDKDYPKLLGDGWKGLPTDFAQGIDAALFYPPTGKVYFFKGNRYVRITNRRVDSEYPKELPGGWKGLPSTFQNGIDAAIYADGHTYFFKGKDYVRFTGYELDKNYPRALPGGWKFKGNFHSNLDAALSYPDGSKNYFFQGDAYNRLTIFREDDGYPKSLPGGWKGLEWAYHNNDCGEGFLDGKHIIYCYNGNSIEQQGMVEDLSAEYQMISKTVSGEGRGANYASIWVKSKELNNPSFSVTGTAKLKEKLDEWQARGFIPSMISASGDHRVTNLYSVVLKKETIGLAQPLVRYDIDTDSLKKMMTFARKNRFLPRSLTQYGSVSKPLYAGVWELNPSRIMWDYGINENYATFLKREAAHKRHGARPLLVTPGPGERVTSVFINDDIGVFQTWVGIRKGELMDKIDEGLVLGYHPIYMDQHNSEEDTNYTVILAKKFAPFPNVFPKSRQGYSPFNTWDETIKKTMKAYNIRAGALAVVYKGRLVHTQGYTYGPEGYPITKPTSLFRMASVSKVITAMAIGNLIDNGQISMETLFKDYIKHEVRGDGNPVYEKIKVKHVLSHSSTLKRDHGLSVNIAKDLQVDLPISIQHKRKWCRKRSLLDSVVLGSDYSYSNLGYTLLGQLIEEVSQQSYQDYVANNILTPLGLDRPQIGSAEGDAPGEVLYQPYNLDLEKSAFSEKEKLVSRAYEGRNYELVLSSGGWIFSVVDMAKLLGAFHSNVQNPVLSESMQRELLTPTVSMGWGGFYETHGWPTRLQDKVGGGKVRVYSKGGASSTTASSVQFREDDISFVLFFNRANGDKVDKYFGALVRELHEYADQMSPSQWPSKDLFPQFGIPPHSFR